MLSTTFTLGPASSDEETLLFLLARADRFRLNASHLSERDLDEWLEKLQRAFGRAHRQIPVVLDLQGAKLRIGTFAAMASIPETVVLFHGAESQDPGRIPVPHEGFFTQLRQGDEISLNDAKVVLQVSECSSDSAVAHVLRNGALSSHKGLNRRGRPMAYHEVTPGDRRKIEQTRGVDFIEYALSFVNSGEEAALVRPLIQGKRLVAKIETPEAMENLPGIAGRFDEIWLCRGDLGAQAGLDRLGMLQAEFAARIPGLNRPCWLAGQVLEHMTHFPMPTRTEVVHLFDAERAGFAGIVLSDETAIGRNPREVARFLRP